jgi:Ni/Co efflux regulator RcnB
MIKPSLVISALLLLSASVANAETTAPATPGSQGAASVQKNHDADKSGGKDEKREAKKERKEDKKEAKKERMEKAEHHEHKDRMERPAKPERPGK